MIRRTRVEVDLSAIVGNARAIQRAVGTELYAVAVAKALAAARAATGFCVSLVEEGVELREAGVTQPVLVMGPSQVGGEDDAVAAGLTPVVSSREEVAELAPVAKRRGPVEAH